jgi:hypothetical protein
MIREGDAWFAWDVFAPVEAYLMADRNANPLGGGSSRRGRFRLANGMAGD